MRINPSLNCHNKKIIFNNIFDKKPLCIFVPVLFHLLHQKIITMSREHSKRSTIALTVAIISLLISFVNLLLL